MSYFIHNKYDKNSNAKVTLSNNMYTYNDDASVIVIDFYGLLESGDTTYRLLDTSSMGSSIIDILRYSNIGLKSDDIVIDQNSEFSFNNSILINTIQRGIVTTGAMAAGEEMLVTINNVDMSKTIVIYDTAGAYNTNYNICNNEPKDNRSTRKHDNKIKHQLQQLHRQIDEIKRHSKIKIIGKELKKDR